MRPPVATSSSSSPAPTTAIRTALLVEAGSGLATQAIPGSAGVPEAVAALTLVLPYNDPAAVDAAFAAHPGRIAAVIVEPVIANAGVIPPGPASSSPCARRPARTARS